jgi:hypothetical protein
MGTKRTNGQPYLNSKANISSLRPNLSCTLTQVIREPFHSQGTLGWPIKGPLPFRQRDMRSRPLSTREPFKHSAHPLQHQFFLHKNLLDVWLLPPQRGLNQANIICVCETTSEQESHDLVDPVICWCIKHG